MASHRLYLICTSNRLFERAGHGAELTLLRIGFHENARQNAGGAVAVVHSPPVGPVRQIDGFRNGGGMKVSIGKCVDPYHIEVFSFQEINKEVQLFCFGEAADSRLWKPNSSRKSFARSQTISNGKKVGLKVRKELVPTFTGMDIRAVAQMKGPEFHVIVSWSDPLGSGSP